MFVFRTISSLIVRQRAVNKSLRCKELFSMQFKVVWVNPRREHYPFFTDMKHEIVL